MDPTLKTPRGRKNEGHVPERRNNKNQAHERIRAQEWQLEPKRMAVREGSQGSAGGCRKEGKHKLDQQGSGRTSTGRASAHPAPSGAQ